MYKYIQMNVLTVFAELCLKNKYLLIFLWLYENSNSRFELIQTQNRLQDHVS